MADETTPTRVPWGDIAPHLAFYSGWPTASTALSIVRRVFDEAANPEASR